MEYKENRRWVDDLPRAEFRKDVLILAGDVTDDLNLLEETFQELKNRFYQVHYIPGNHDLWVRHGKGIDSLEKHKLVQAVSRSCRVWMEPGDYGDVSIIPLYAWYDYSFGEPNERILEIWSDYYACRWPAGVDEKQATRYFIEINREHLKKRNKWVISFSHFLPRIDLMPSYIPPEKRDIYPVLGTALLEKQIRCLGADIHVFGHTHVNTTVVIDDVTYINNALGYPHEKRISARELKRVF
jgi:predicted phosphodiesterase